MIDNQDIAVPGHPVGIHHGAVGHGFDGGAGGGGDQHAITAPPIRQPPAKTGQQIARHRPAHATLSLIHI